MDHSMIENLPPLKSSVQTVQSVQMFEDCQPISISSKQKQNTNQNTSNQKSVQGVQYSEIKGPVRRTSGFDEPLDLEGLARIHPRNRHLYCRLPKTWDECNTFIDEFGVEDAANEMRIAHAEAQDANCKNTEKLDAYWDLLLSCLKERRREYELDEHWRLQRGYS